MGNKQGTYQLWGRACNVLALTETYNGFVTISLVLIGCLIQEIQCVNIAADEVFCLTEDGICTG